MSESEIYRMADVLHFDDEEEEEFCDECGFPVDKCECDVDDDAEGPEAA